MEFSNWQIFAKYQTKGGELAMKDAAVKALDFIKKSSNSKQLIPRDDFTGLKLDNARGAEMICDCGSGSDCFCE